MILPHWIYQDILVWVLKILKQEVGIYIARTGVSYASHCNPSSLRHKKQSLWETLEVGISLPHYVQLYYRQDWVIRNAAMKSPLLELLKDFTSWENDLVHRWIQQWLLKNPSDWERTAWKALRLLCWRGKHKNLRRRSTASNIREVSM